MKRSGEEILADIDCTLDRLIENANAIQNIALLEKSELEAMQKTQESLFAHLLYNMKDRKYLQAKRSSSLSNLQQKLNRFSRLNARLVQEIADHFKNMDKRKKKPRIGRNRKNTIKLSSKI
jgi:tRNA A22 N-methylase